LRPMWGWRKGRPSTPDLSGFGKPAGMAVRLRGRGEGNSGMSGTPPVTAALRGDDDPAACDSEEVRPGGRDRPLAHVRSVGRHAFEPGSARLFESWCFRKWEK